MKNILRINLILFLVFNGCGNDSDNIAEPVVIDNEPVVVNTTNSYSISVDAQDLSLNRLDSLTFESDSLVVIETLTNYSNGTALFRVLSSDSSRIYNRFFFRDTPLSKTSIIGQIPAGLAIELKDFTGIISFKVVTYNDTLTYDTTGTKKNPDAIYFNTFESSEDLGGWNGRGTFAFHNEAPLGGGSQSLFVSGGSISPHATFVLPPLKEDGFFILQCWAKNPLSGGSVSLLSNVQGSRNRTYIYIDSPGWQLYRAPDTLFCPADSALTLEIFAGGFSPSAILVDLLQVRKVGPSAE